VFSILDFEVDVGTGYWHQWHKSHVYFSVLGRITFGNRDWSVSKTSRAMTKMKVNFFLCLIKH